MRRTATQPDATDPAAQWQSLVPAPLRAALTAALANHDEQAAQLGSALALLDDLEVDSETRQAALIDGAGLTTQALELPPKDLPAGLRTLLQGLAEASKVWELWEHKSGHTGAEGLRRLLLVLIRDLRVVFVLLVAQVVQLRQLAHAPAEAQRHAAQLTADIHAPLANRLGIWQLKWELEDWTFRFLQPEVYRRVARLLGERRADREGYIDRVLSELRSALDDAGIKGAQIAGRPKHIFSIWKKMQRKGVDFDQLYDVRAVRVLVEDVPTCYAVLGLVHGLWQYIPGEFDDYIAHPKGNDYRSLHTAVIGPGGTSLEVQIRTFDMHRQAELGVAAHWRYKEGGSADSSFERKVAEMRQLLEQREEGDDAQADDSALLAGFSTEALEDRVYVLTPKGEVVDMARGCTVLDFAYQVHTMVGHRCRGAKVNGRIVPLTHTPASGDRIEVLTGKEAAPRRDWLSPQNGYLKSARSRTKVRNWFNRLDFDQNVRDGKEIVDRELNRLALASGGLEALLPKLGIDKLDDLYAQVALGDLSPAQIARVAHEQQSPARDPLPLAKQTQRPTDTPKDAIVIDGVGNLLVSMAQCCHPLPGDPVQGFITRGRGIRVHHADCGSLRHLATRHPERVVEVQWGRAANQRFEVRIRIDAYDRPGLLRDVGTVMATAQINVLSLTSQAGKDGSAVLHVDLAVGDFEQLSQLLSRLREVANVVGVQRVGG